MVGDFCSFSEVYRKQPEGCEEIFPPEWARAHVTADLRLIAAWQNQRHGRLVCDACDAEQR